MQFDLCDSPEFVKYIFSKNLHQVLFQLPFVGIFISHLSVLDTKEIMFLVFKGKKVPKVGDRFEDEKLLKKFAKVKLMIENSITVRFSL